MKAKLFIAICLFVSIYFQLTAQKLPNKQEKSIWAPTNIKIDGRPDEWNDQFQAYNNATEIYYTIANNNNILYMVIQAKSDVIIRKIISHGITFTLDGSTKKNEKEKWAITYPLVKSSDRSMITSNLKRLKINQESAKKIVIVKAGENDSLTIVINDMLTKKAKEMRIMGAKTDDTISIYNEHHINVASHLDNNENFTVEMAIPFNYLQTDVNDLSTINYNITLNGSATADHISLRLTPNGDATIRDAGVGMTVTKKNTPESLAFDFPTDFSGEYTLAKKP